MILPLSILFWLMFASAMTIFHARQLYTRDRWEYWALTVLGGPIYLVGFPYDIVFQHSVGCLIFLEFPQRRTQGKGWSAWEWTFTSRLKRHVKAKDHWRGTLARFICEKLVEPWDWNHCGLANRP